MHNPRESWIIWKLSATSSSGCLDNERFTHLRSRPDDVNNKLPNSRVLLAVRPKADTCATPPALPRAPFHSWWELTNALTCAHRQREQHETMRWLRALTATHTQDPARGYVDRYYVIKGIHELNLNVNVSKRAGGWRMRQDRMKRKFMLCDQKTTMKK